MNDDRKPIEQRIGEVLSSGKLTGASLNVVIALGVTAIKQPLAEAIFWLKYSNHAPAYGQSLREVEKLSKQLDAKGNWRLRHGRLKAMAKAVLDYYIDDTCSTCEGRGWKQPEGAPYLSDDPCEACLAKPGGRPGKRPFPWLAKKPKVKFKDRDKPQRRKQLGKRRARIDAVYVDAHKALLCELEELERQVGGKVIEAMAKDVKRITRPVREAEQEVEGRATLSKRQ